MKKIVRKLAPRWVKAIYRKVRGVHGAGRMFTVRKGDIHIVSYPKSGNTWTRFLIANLVYGGKVDFSNIEKLVPDIYVNSNDKLLALPSPRFIKSHESFDPRYRRVILIVRDPRDVAISYMHFLRKHGQILDGSDTFSFIESFVNGKLDEFGSWGENIGSWLGARDGDGSMLVLRYEDMLVDPERELKEIANFIGFDVSDERIRDAVENSSFNRLKEMEKQQSKDWAATRNTRQDIPFMRSGKSGDWKVALSEEAVGMIEYKWGGLMRRLGYLERR